MQQIKVLDKNTINQIAAGEVIERPASVVKELVENSIDAGATAVTCEISGGGIDIIRITDNGSGIGRDDVRTAFLRHATSKIKSAKDLEAVLSLGFRGEALASIASVAKVELITKTRDSFTGIRYLIADSEEISFEEIGCPDGTTFIVRDLFANVPVRRKFLKTAATESSYVTELIERIAISHPEVSIKYINNGKNQLFTSGNSSVKNILYSIYGRDISSQLVEIDGEEEGIKTTGFIAKPVVARSNRAMENFFVNGRYIKSNIICKALEDAYSPYLMQHKYPFAALHFDIAADRLDVNVHPTKQEIRFENSEDLYRSVYNLVSHCLQKLSHVQAETPALTAVPKDQTEKKEPLQEPAFVPEQKDKTVFVKEEAAMPAVPERPVLIESLNPKSQLVFDISPSKGNEITGVRPETKEDFKKGLKADYRIVGQIFNTYWIIEHADELYMIDQHAAHEKIIFEKMTACKDACAGLSQIISPPRIVSFTALECSTVEAHLNEIKELGFELESFGGREYSLSSAPCELYGLDPVSVLNELVESFKNEAGGKRISEKLNLRDRLAGCSCKAAVKGNTRLSYAEAKALITELLELENPFNCPHGRPIFISMSKSDIEKKFKRII